MEMRILPFFLVSLSLAFSSEAIIQKSWNFVAANNLPAAIATLEAVPVNDPTKSNALLDQALFYEALGNVDSTRSKAYQAFQLRKDPDLLFFSIGHLFSALRQRDSLWTTRMEEILSWVEKNHPDHPVRTELQAEIVMFRAGQYTLDTLLTRLDRLGLIRQWKMVGPYENISGSGMNSRLAPEMGKWGEPGEKGKDGLPIEAREFKHLNADGWLRLDHIQGLSHAVNFFATEVDVSESRTAILEFGVSGSFVVWVNGELVLQEFQFRNLGMGGFRIPVALRKGANQIVVKIGHEENHQSDFALCLKDSVGMPFHFQTKIPSKMDILSPQLAANKKPLTSPWHFARGKGTSMGEFVQRAYYLINNDEFDDARVILQELIQKYPQTGFIHTLLGEAYQREEKYALSDQHYQYAKKLDPKLSVGWNYEFQLRASREDWPALISWFEKRPKTLKPSPSVIFGAIKGYFSISQDLRGWAWVDSLEKMYPQDPEAWQYASGVHMALGNHEKGMQLLAQAGRRIYILPAVLNDLVENYRTQGHIQEAMKLVKGRLSFVPNSTADWLNLANLAFQAKEWDLAIESARKGSVISPYYSKLRLLRARALEMRGKPGDIEEAAKEYHLALRIPSVDFEIGARLDALNDQKSLTQMMKTWSLDSLRSEALRWDLAKADQSVILLQQRSMRVQEWGGTEQRLRLVVLVNDSRGVDQWKEENVRGYFMDGSVVITKAKTHKKDGSLREAEISGTQIVFTGLEPGDLIEVEAHCEDRKEGPLAGHFWTSHLMAHAFPLLHSEFELFVPKQVPIAYQVVTPRFAGEVQKSEVDGQIRSVWHAEKVAGMRHEEGMPDWNDALPRVVISSVPDWETISSWYGILSEGKSKASYELRQVADTLFKGAKTVEEKVRRVHELVVRQVRYSYQSFRQSGFVPQEATKTWTTRIGDCKDMATLGKALLALAGVKSHIVLVNTNDQERLATLPMDGFNHAILWVDMKGGRYIDFTASDNGWETIPRGDQGALSLIVSDQVIDSAKWIPWDTESSISRLSMDTLDLQGNLTRNVHHVRTGNFAAAYRNEYNNESPERQRQLAFKGLQSMYTGIELKKLEMTGLDSLQKPLRYRTDYRIRNLGTVQGKLMVVPMVWSDAIETSNLPQEETRKFAWTAWKLWIFTGSMSQICHVALPMGAKLLTEPFQRELKGRYGRYFLQLIKESEFSIQIVRKWEPTPYEILPEEYVDARAELEKLIQSDRTSILLQLP